MFRFRLLFFQKSTWSSLVKKMNYKNFFAYISAILLTLIILFLPYLIPRADQEAQGESLRIMSYSSFIQKWGAGPEVAERFTKETGIPVHWINAGNAGLLIERLKFKRSSDKPDLVIGFDQFSIHEARKAFKWLDVRGSLLNRKKSLLPFGSKMHDFLAYDWGPMTFVYRKGDLSPPQSLKDLSDGKYRNKIILQDPRMSSPGLQFLFWVLSEMGEERGFKFLKEMKDSIQIMSPSWSSSYSLFKMQDSSLVFSYFTSPYYHMLEEENDTYTAVHFDTPHPVQVEYAGIPEFCNNCDNAKKFIKFLLRKDVQKILMKKNYMYPVSAQALEGSEFALPKNIKYQDPMESLSLIRKKKDLVRRWKKIFY